MLATTSLDGQLRIWNAEHDEPIHIINPSSSALAVAWAPDGQVLATVGASGENAIEIWDAITGKAFKSINVEAANVGYFTTVHWSPNGFSLAVGGADSNIYLFDAETWSLKHKLVGHSDTVLSIAWSPDGKALVSGANDASLRLWDAESGQLLYALEGHSGPILDVDWSPDGSVIASASDDHTVRLWHTDSERQIRVLEGHTNGVTGISFSFDGRLLASQSQGGHVRLWRANVWEEVARFKEPSPCALSGLAFHPRSYILAAPTEQGAVNLWEMDVKRLLAEKGVPETVHYANAKVVLVGDSGVGKSGLGLVLTGESFAPTESTHGRRVWTLARFEDDSNEDGQAGIREVLLWDLAGQPEYRLVHQLYLNEVAVALVLFDARSTTDPFAGVRYWDRALKQAEMLQGNAGPRLKKILVEARADRGSIGVSMERINALVRDLGFEAYIKTSAREGWGVAELREATHRAIDWPALPVVSSTALFQKIMAFLIGEKEAGRLLSSTSDLYGAFLQAEKIPTGVEDLWAQFETCIGRVESRGLIKRLSFGNLVLLQPELVDGYASALVSAAKEEPDGLGYIDEEDARSGRFRISEGERIKDRELEKLLLISTVEDLLRYEIALRERGSRGTYLVFPSQLTRENPDLPDPEGKSVIFEFEGALLNVYATLAVRLSRSSVLVRKEMWKNAVTYTAAGGGTCGMFLRELQEGRGELTLFFDQDASVGTRLQFEQYVHTHLQRRALPESIKMRRIFTCPSCLTPVSDVAARRRRERGFETITCQVCEAIIPIDDRYQPEAALSTAFLQEVDKSADARRERETAASILQGKIATKDFDVFLAHYPADKPYIRFVAEELKEYGLLPWFDESEVRPGSLWHQAFERDMENIRSAVVFVGRGRRNYWEQSEEVSYLKEFLSTGRQVLALTLPGATPQDVPSYIAETSFMELRGAAADVVPQLVALIKGQGHRAVSKTAAGARRLLPDRPERGLNRREEVERKLNDALRRVDWAAAQQHKLELARIAQSEGRSQEVVTHALDALEISDDPMRLAGKGLAEPVRLLAETSINALEEALPKRRHRTEVLRELRALASEGREDIARLVDRWGIAPWSRWFDAPVPDVFAIDSLPREGRGWPAIRLLRLRLENIKNFERFQLDLQQDGRLSHRCFAIVGDNATGKTTLLQAITLGCLGVSLANQEHLNARSLLRDGVESGSIEIEFELSVDSDATESEKLRLAVGLELARNEAACRVLSDEKMEFGRTNKMEHLGALRNRIGFDWGFCCGYGAYRGLREASERMGVHSAARAEVDRVLSLFLPQSTLMDPETLQALLRTEVSGISRERQNIPLGVRDDILSMFSEIIPGMEVQEQDGQPELIERWSGVRTLAALSDGYNSMFGLLGHLVRHALEITGWLRKSDDSSSSDNSGSPLSVVGMVLIDEVDLHLHPKWQRHILSQLQGAFPNLQIIVTTHSPLVLGATPDAQVIVLRRNEANVVEPLTDLPSVKGWRVDQLLTGLPFDVSSAYDPYTERLSARYAELLNRLGPEHKEVRRLEEEFDALNQLGHGSTRLDRRAWELLNEFVDYRMAKMDKTERDQTLARLWRMLEEQP
jgi:WD40 repeat protein